MDVPKLNFVFRFFDFLLWPFMWILGGFVFPVQETHQWHARKYNWRKAKGLIVKEKDLKAKFGHEAPLGLFHMAIFGGLTRYVVIEAIGFKNYWNIGWESGIQILPIKQSKIMMFVGKNGFVAYGIGDGDKVLKLRVVGYGNLGDFKYKNIRLF